ncbi:MAG: shikimate dehydrogenase [Ruminococcaceae bacterium]|nr:shikimate dehydrogenase [Oscillospiraceae bacterium]
MRYGLIGEHLGHSFSREIHERIADYKYEIHEIAPDALGDFLSNPTFEGINITIPYKEKAIPYLYFVSDNAKKIGAVNTVKNENGKLYGYNTDYMGMRALILRNKIDLKDKKALILGCGGTAKTGYAVLSDLGVRQIVRVGREGEGADVLYKDVLNEHSDAEFILNTTPVGMYPKNEGKIIDVNDFPKLEGLIDVVYNPLRTNIVLDARKKGIKAESGLYMLVSQAIYASEIFTGNKISEELCTATFNEILSQKENIVLVGMPSCGKTTVGHYLASQTGRELIDTDDEIVKRIGMEISEYFALYGEEKFREVESEAVKEACAKNGAIIATGGGAILRDENVRYMKQNGRVYFLNRALDLLTPTSDRPTASDYEALRKRYNERYSKYISCADAVVPANGTVVQVAEIIKGEFFG